MADIFKFITAAYHNYRYTALANFIRKRHYPTTTPYHRQCQIHWHALPFWLWSRLSPSDATRIDH